MQEQLFLTSPPLQPRPSVCTRKKGGAPYNPSSSTILLMLFGWSRNILLDPIYGMINPLATTDNW